MITLVMIRYILFQLRKSVTLRYNKQLPGILVNTGLSPFHQCPSRGGGGRGGIGVLGFIS